MAGGSFQTSREIFEHPIWQDVTKFRLFFYIYGQAVFSDVGVRVGDIVLKRGQYLRSYRNLSKDLEYVENRQVKSYSISTIKRTIDKLVKENRLLIEDTELGTLFTVVNYEEYQGFGSVKKENLAQQENSVGTVAEQSRNNNNNVKKEKKDIKTSIGVPPYEEIIDYLNMRADKNFKYVESNKKLILARWKEGQRLDDFKTVIDNMVGNWKGVVFTNGQIGDNYLQPKTLFSDKFEGYRNQVPKRGGQAQQNIFDEMRKGLNDGQERNAISHPINNDILPKL